MEEAYEEEDEDEMDEDGDEDDVDVDYDEESPSEDSSNTEPEDEIGEEEMNTEVANPPDGWGAIDEDMGEDADEMAEDEDEDEGEDEDGGADEEIIWQVRYPSAISPLELPSLISYSPPITMEMVRAASCTMKQRRRTI